MCYLMICPSCSWRVTVRMLYYHPKTHQFSINLLPYSYTHPHTSQQCHKGKSDIYRIRVITDDQFWSVQPCTCCDSGSDSACTKRVQQNHGGGFFRKKKEQKHYSCLLLSSQTKLGFGDFRIYSYEYE